MRIDFIANPNSGRGLGPRRAGEIASILARRGHDCRIRLGRSRQDAIEWAKEASKVADRLVVIGGDGSLSAVVDGLPVDAPPIALAPLGTSNMLATELKLPRRPFGTAKLVESENQLCLDTGIVSYTAANDLKETLTQRSFLVWDFGLGAELMRRMNEKRDGPIHKTDYLPLLGKIIKNWAPTAQRVIADGEDLGEFEFGVISGMRTYGIKAFRLGKAEYTDGLWEIYLFPKINLATTSFLAAASATGRLTQIPGVVHRKVKTVQVMGLNTAPLQIDGDYVGTTSVEFSLNAPPLSLLLP